MLRRVVLFALIARLRSRPIPRIVCTRLRSGGRRAQLSRIPQLYSASSQMICNMPTRAGKRRTKEQYIAAVMKGPPRYESFTFSEVKIVFYGKAAVLTGYCRREDGRS